MKGAMKPVYRNPLTMPKVEYKQMATVLQTGAQDAVVAVGATVKTWAGEEMVNLSKADIVGRDFASPLAVAVEFWYPNLDGGRKKDPSNWTKHLTLAIAVGWRKAQLDGCVAMVDELVFPRRTSHGKARLHAHTLTHICADTLESAQKQHVYSRFVNGRAEFFLASGLADIENVSQPPPHALPHACPAARRVQGGHRRARHVPGIQERIPVHLPPSGRHPWPATEETARSLRLHYRRR